MQNICREWLRTETGQVSIISWIWVIGQAWKEKSIRSWKMIFMKSLVWADSCPLCSEYVFQEHLVWRCQWGWGVKWNSGISHETIKKEGDLIDLTVDWTTIISFFKFCAYTVVLAFVHEYFELTVQGPVLWSAPRCWGLRESSHTLALPHVGGDQLRAFHFRSINTTGDSVSWPTLVWNTTKTFCP